MAVIELKQYDSNPLVEKLNSEFQGNLEHVDIVVNFGMEVFAHNVDILRRLQPVVRDRRAVYQQILSMLERAKTTKPEAVIKISTMLSVGESEQKSRQTM